MLGYLIVVLSECSGLAVFMVLSVFVVLAVLDVLAVFAELAGMFASIFQSRQIYIYIYICIVTCLFA